MELLSLQHSGRAHHEGGLAKAVAGKPPQPSVTRLDTLLSHIELLQQKDRNK